MADSTLIFPPGWRALDPDGDIIPGAWIRVFEANTTTPRQVYSDEGLSTSLGTEIECDTGGYPTSDGNAKTLIYTGVDAYKLQCYTTDPDDGGTLVWEHDDIRGALDTSALDIDAVVATPVEAIVSSQAIQSSDRGRLFNVNQTGGDVTLTLDAAATLGDGWRAGFRVAGTTNQVIFASAGGTFDLPGISGVSQFALSRLGEEIWIRCDGAGFIIGETAPPFLGTLSILQIQDRLTAPPGSEQPGYRYIISGSPTGAWASFAQHDVVEYTGTGWMLLIDASASQNADLGMVAYVIDEDANYQLRGSAWTAWEETPPASDTVAGKAEIATQAEIEAATDNTLIVPPGRMKFHPGVCKAWAYFGLTGNILASHNVTSVSDDGNGVATVTINEDLSSANYAVNVTLRNNANVRVGAATTIAAGTVAVEARASGGPDDPSSGWFVTVFGDQ